MTFGDPDLIPSGRTHEGRPTYYGPLGAAPVGSLFRLPLNPGVWDRVVCNERSYSPDIIVEVLPPEDWEPEPAEGDEWVRATALTEWASTQREAADDYEAQGLAAEAAELRRQAAVADRCAASPTAGDPEPGDDAIGSLADLDARMAEAAKTLTMEADRRTALLGLDRLDDARLRGKAEGVALARDYLRLTRSAAALGGPR